MNQSSKLWTGSFVGICLVNFFIFVNFHALLPTFPFFVTYLGGYLAGLLVKYFSYDTMFLWMIVPCVALAISYRVSARPATE